MREKITSIFSSKVDLFHCCVWVLFIKICRQLVRFVYYSSYMFLMATAFPFYFARLSNIMKTFQLITLQKSNIFFPCPILTTEMSECDGTPSIFVLSSIAPYSILIQLRKTKTLSWVFYNYRRVTRNLTPILTQQPTTNQSDQALLE